MLPLRNFSETMARLRQDLGAPFRGLYDELVNRLTQTATAEGALKDGDFFRNSLCPTRREDLRCRRSCCGLARW